MLSRFSRKQLIGLCGVIVIIIIGIFTIPQLIARKDITVLTVTSPLTDESVNYAVDYGDDVPINTRSVDGKFVLIGADKIGDAAQQKAILDELSQFLSDTYSVSPYTTYISIKASSIKPYSDGVADFDFYVTDSERFFSYRHTKRASGEIVSVITEQPWKGVKA